MKTIIKTIQRTGAVLGALIALAALAAAGCSLLGPEQAGAPEAGVLRVSLTTGEGAGRTLLPQYDVTSLYYTLTFTAAGGPAKAEDLESEIGTIDKGQSFGNFTLAAGTWDLEVLGFVDQSAAANSDNALVSGGETGIILSGPGGAPSA